MAGHEGGGAEPCLAHFPDALLRLPIADQFARDGMAFAFQAGDQAFGAGDGLLLAVAAEFGDQPAAALGQGFDAAFVQVLGAHVIDEALVHAFEAERPIRAHERNGVAGGEDIGEADHDEHALGRAVHEPQPGFQHRDASAFAADQCAGDVESLFGQELVEIVAGDTARDLRIAGADQIGVAMAQFVELAIDLAVPPAGGNDRAQLILARRSDAQPQPVIGQDVELAHIVGGAAGHHRMHAAGIVADHAAQRVVVVGRRIGAKRQVIFLGGVAQIVEDAARLDPGGARVRLDRQDMVQVFRIIGDDRGVAALAGKARAAAARQKRSAVFTAQPHRRDDVLDALRHDDSDRYLPVVRAVGRIERAVAGREADFACDPARQGARQCGGLAVGIVDEFGGFALGYRSLAMNAASGGGMGDRVGDGHV
jgi:hypothetical protein